MAQPGLTQFQCGSCRSVAQGQPGATVACPSCGQHVQVPGAAVAPGYPVQQQQQYGAQPQYGQQHGGGGFGGQPMQPMGHHAAGGGMGMGAAAAGAGYSHPSQYMVPVKGAKADEKQWNENNDNRAKWETPLLMAGCKQPLWFCCGFLPSGCMCATVYMQRRKLLMADKDESNWQYYHCCAGIWGQSMTEKCDGCTKGNEQVCACCEAFCCPNCGAHGNRYMVMLHYGLENTCCDIFLFYLACVCQIVACITGMDELEAIADFLYYLLMGCMAAQHEDEMSKKGYPMGQNMK